MKNEQLKMNANLYASTGHNTHTNKTITTTKLVCLLPFLFFCTAPALPCLMNDSHTAPMTSLTV